MCPAWSVGWLALRTLLLPSFYIKHQSKYQGAQERYRVPERLRRSERQALLARRSRCDGAAAGTTIGITIANMNSQKGLFKGTYKPVVRVLPTSGDWRPIPGRVRAWPDDDNYRVR